MLYHQSVVLLQAVVCQTNYLSLEYYLLLVAVNLETGYDSADILSLVSGWFLHLNVLATHLYSQV